MANTGKSRWVDTAEDAVVKAQRREEREAKRRLKAQKARLEEEEATRQKVLTRQGAQTVAADQPDRPPPAKRRRLSTDGDEEGAGIASGPRIPARGELLRFEGGGFGRCRSVENYDKLNDIEEGAYGWVARAREIATGRVVALKRLKIDANDRGGLPVTGLREIQVLKDCDHRHIVKLREVVVGEDTRKIENIFLVLEFVEHDLKSILEDMPEPFLASEVKTLLRQLASGVAYLHDRCILHRDLKTSNLLLNNHGQLKIADFGMARYVGTRRPADLTQLVVTLWYRAPELLLGATAYGPAVDMWSVGCVFGELLTREPLLQGRNEADQVARIFALCGVPTDTSWPGFRRLPHARALRNLPKASDPAGAPSIRASFPLLTTAGAALLGDLLALDPDRRPTAADVLRHEYFTLDPKPKHEDLFPTFPSKAGRERRRRRNTPNAPLRGEAAELGTLDLGGIFSGRDTEERGAGFSLRMV